MLKCFMKCMLFMHNLHYKYHCMMLQCRISQQINEKINIPVSQPLKFNAVASTCQLLWSYNHWLNGWRLGSIVTWCNNWMVHCIILLLHDSYCDPYGSISALVISSGTKTFCLIILCNHGEGSHFFVVKMSGCVILICFLNYHLFDQLQH